MAESRVPPLAIASKPDSYHAAACKAFRFHRPNLLAAINCSTRLTDLLYSREAISEGVRNKLSPDVLGLSKDDKIMILLNEVEDRMKVVPAVFQVFVQALQSDSSLQPLATALLDTQRSLSVSSSDIGAVTDLSPVSRYARYLLSYYNTTQISPDFMWPLTPSSEYINTAVIERKLCSESEATEFQLCVVHGNIDHVLKDVSTRSFRIEDVLAPDEQDQLRFVLVEGAPGVGKSALAWELCRRWDKLEALRRFRLVVLLRLRDEYVQRATNLDDIFFHDDPQLQQSVVQEVVRTDGEGVLFVLDGADECPASVRNDHRSMFHRLLTGASLPRATVLVTSRRSISTDLQRKVKPNRHVEILGFTEAQILQYAQSVFRSEPELLAIFQRYISSTPSIRGMLYIPINAAMATAVFRAKASEGKPFPATLTQLYRELCSLLLQRYLLREKIVENLEDLPLGVDDTNFPTDVWKDFLSLAESAFKGTLSQQLVFPSLPVGSRSLGFTTGSPELHTGRRLSYNFLHLTVQEYLAAVYVSTLTTEQQKEIFEKHHLKPHLERVWQFVAGLNHRTIAWDQMRATEAGKFVRISSSFENSGLKLNDYVSPFLLRCLYETQDRSLCDSVLGAGKVALLAVFSQLTPFDSFALGYCLACSRCTWYLGLVGQVHLWPELVEGIKSVNPERIQSSVHTLDLRGTRMSQENLTCLKDLPFRTVSKLGLSACKLLHAILPVLTNLKNLTFFMFAEDAHDIDLVDLAAGLHKNTTVVELDIQCVDFGSHSSGDLFPSDVIASAFAELLKVNRSLKIVALALEPSPITIQGATALAEAVNVNTTLKKLVLYSGCTQEAIEQMKHCYPNIHNRVKFIYKSIKAV